MFRLTNKTFLIWYKADKKLPNLTVNLLNMHALKMDVRQLQELYIFISKGTFCIHCTYTREKQINSGNIHLLLQVSNK